MSVPTRAAGVALGLSVTLWNCAGEQVQHESVPAFADHWAGVWKLVGDPPDDLDGAPSCIATVEIALDAEPSVERQVTGTVTWCGTPYRVKARFVPHEPSSVIPSYYGQVFCLLAIPARMGQTEQHFGKWMLSVREDPIDSRRFEPVGTKLFVAFDPMPPYPGGQFGYTHTLTYVRSEQ